MGRTIPSARMLMDLEIERIMRTYGKNLTMSEKKLLTDILQTTKKHVDAFGESVRLVPCHAILLTALIEQEKQLQSLLADGGR